VEVLTSGTLGGKVVFPDERTPDMFQTLRRETFLLRGRTLADFRPGRDRESERRPATRQK
jgi:hypothetical protein